MALNDIENDDTILKYVKKSHTFKIIRLYSNTCCSRLFISQSMNRKMRFMKVMFFQQIERKLFVSSVFHLIKAYCVFLNNKRHVKQI